MKHCDQEYAKNYKAEKCDNLFEQDVPRLAYFPPSQPTRLVNQVGTTTRLKRSYIGKLYVQIFHRCFAKLSSISILLTAYE